MKHAQSGFSVLIGLCVLLVLGSLGFMIWRVNHADQRKAAPANTNATKIYTDTAGTFTFSYPEKWTTRFIENSGHDGPSQPEPDWTKTSRPVLIAPDEGQKDNVIRVTPGCDTQDLNGKRVSVLQSLQDRKDRFHTQEMQTINGYQGFYDKLDFEGDVEAYLDHTYFVTDGKDCVTFVYRERWKHGMGNTDFNDSKNVSAFAAMVESVKFP